MRWALNMLSGRRVTQRSVRPPVSRRRVYHERIGPQRLDDHYYGQISARLGIDKSMVRAIAVIESAEKGLTDRGFPVVRFERAYWKRYRIATREAQAFDKARNSVDLNERWVQFTKMHEEDPFAAVMCHSFGWAQIMGFNHRACGHEDTEGFLESMRTLQGQGRMFMAFVRPQPQLLNAMREHNYSQVAYHYNGPRYARNRYDVKLAGLIRDFGYAWA
ncbi:MAG: N-acetylmuramidase domain-containing protein [Pseudomonadota bacterium]